MRTIWASSVSLPTRSARITKPPAPFTVPPVTRLPGAFSTGIGSTVTLESSTALVPSTTTPSRSGEHTSELPSLAYLACRLLLGKKKLSDGRDRLGKRGPCHPPL